MQDEHRMERQYQNENSAICHVQNRFSSSSFYVILCHKDVFSILIVNREKGGKRFNLLHLLYVQSEAEQDCDIRKSKDANNLKLVGSNRKGGLFRSNDGMVDQMKNLQTWSSQHSAFVAADPSATTLVCNQLLHIFARSNLLIAECPCASLPVSFAKSKL